MEIASEYIDLQSLQDYIHLLFGADFICSLGISLPEIHSTVEFFITNWSALKLHDPNVIVGSSVLVGMYHMGGLSIKRKYKIMKKFHTSITSMKSCIYKSMKARGIPLNYNLDQIANLINNRWGELIKC